MYQIEQLIQFFKYFLSTSNFSEFIIKYSCSTEIQLDTCKKKIVESMDLGAIPFLVIIMIHNVPYIISKLIMQLNAIVILYNTFL